MSEPTRREQTEEALAGPCQCSAYQRLVLRTIPPHQEEGGAEGARKARLSLLALGLSCHVSILSAVLLGGAVELRASGSGITPELCEAVRFHLGNVLWHLAAIFALERLNLGELYEHGQNSLYDKGLLHRDTAAGDQIGQLYVLARVLASPPFATLDILFHPHNVDRKTAWISSGLRMMGAVKICAEAFGLSLEEIMAYNLQVLKGEREVGGSTYFQQNILGAADDLPRGG